MTRRGIRKTLDVVGHQVDAPRVRVPGRPVVGHAAGDVLPVLREREVAAEPLVRLLRLPAEQTTVEVDRLAGVRAVQVDPARSADDERWCRHLCLPCRGLGAMTASPRGSHRSVPIDGRASIRPQGYGYP